MITIPNIPTDNYYKFLSLSGITIVIISVIFFYTEIKNLSTEIDNIEYEITKLNLDKKYLIQDSLRLDNQLGKMIKNLAKYKVKNPDLNSNFKNYSKKNKILMQKDKNYRDYLEFIFKNQDKIYPEFAIVEELKLEAKKQTTTARELELKTKLIKLKLRISKNKNNTLFFIIFSSLIPLIMGFTMAKNGFKKWYLLVQKPSDEKLKLEIAEMKKKIESDNL